jgi:hypothetical protein
MNNTTQQNGTNHELATLLCLVLKHPKTTPRMQEGIYGILSEVAPIVDYYDTPEGIALFIEGHGKLAERNEGRHA